MSCKLSSLALAACLAAAANAHATDGVIEINQAKIDAAGGGTYVISQPGSYRLTSNLTQKPGASVINIATGGVSVDLNGFAITGANTCAYTFGTTPVVTCSSTSGGSAIEAIAAVGNISVGNGSIRGMEHSGVNLAIAHNTRVENLAVRHCGSVGIAAGNGVAHRVTAMYNGSHGISTDAGGIADCVASYNGGFGVASITGATIRNCSVRGNVGYGILIFGGSVVDNVITYNGTAGLFVGDSSTYRGNLLAHNDDVTQVLTAPGKVLINGGGNLCGNAVCP